MHIIYIVCAPMMGIYYKSLKYIYSCISCLYLRISIKPIEFTGKCPNLGLLPIDLEKI